MSVQPPAITEAVPSVFEPLLTECVNNLPSTGVVVCKGPLAELVEVFALEWAYRLCGPGSRDVRVASPTGAAWTVDEVDELLIGPASLAPETINVLVVARAATLPVDRVLKTFEEPPAPTLWLLVVGDDEELAATLRSRVVATVEVETRPPSALVERFEAAGVHMESFARCTGGVVDLWEHLDTTAAATVATNFATAATSPSPASVSHLFTSLRALAAASKTDAPATKRVMRSAAAGLHAVWVEKLCVALRDGADPELVETAAEVFSRSKAAITMHAKVETHMTAGSLAARNALRSIVAG